MAKAMTNINVEVLLRLNEKEAEFIKDLTQNFLGEDIECECQEDQKMRIEIFDSLKEALDKARIKD